MSAVDPGRPASEADADPLLRGHLGANAHASARGLARLYAALLEPGRILSRDLLDEATRVQAEGPCPVLGERIAFGLGFTPTSARRKLGSSDRAFGFFGTGGSVGFADPEIRVAFGYVTSRVAPGWQTKRNRALLDALDAVWGRADRRGVQGS